MSTVEQDLRDYHANLDNAERAWNQGGCDRWKADVGYAVEDFIDAWQQGHIDFTDGSIGEAWGPDAWPSDKIADIERTISIAGIMGDHAEVGRIKCHYAIPYIFKTVGLQFVLGKMSDWGIKPDADDVVREGMRQLADNDAFQRQLAARRKSENSG